MKKTVIIAAAGIGSRLGAGIPKCLVEVRGHAIFEYQLKALAWADEVRMVVGYKADEVMQKVSAVNSNVVFIHNRNFQSTNLRQSYFLGASGVSGKALFLDGDTIIGWKASRLLHQACEAGKDYIAVAKTRTKNPIYAGVEDEKVRWFSYDRCSKYELANAAFLAVDKLKYENTLFYVQLEEYLPTTALLMEGLEVDTPEDLQDAEKTITSNWEEYDFWR